MLPSLQSSPRRRPRVALVVPVCLVAASLGVSSPAAASAPNESRVLASSVVTTTSASTTAATGTSPVIGRLLQWLSHRGSLIVRRATIRFVQRQAVAWTRQQAINWYCWTWYRYFGYDYRSWRWAATYFYGPRWALNFCSTYG
jgi:hypothetical protein